MHVHPTQSFDIKTFIEIRVGLINWLLLDVACLAKQYERYGFVTDSMWLVVGFQVFYITDALWFEEAFFSTMDVAYGPTYKANWRTDGSGFMLDMGNCLWMAYFYCLQARFLVSYPVVLGPYGVAGVLGLKALGYYIFRSANLQKDKFRADDPSVKGILSHISHVRHGIHSDRDRIKAVSGRMVGKGTTHQLYGRLDHGVVMVPSSRIFHSSSISLRLLFRGISHRNR